MMRYKWAWNELQQIDPEPQDLSYIASVVPRGSANHLIAEKKLTVKSANHILGELIIQR